MNEFRMFSTEGYRELKTNTTLKNYFHYINLAKIVYFMMMYIYHYRIIEVKLRIFSYSNNIIYIVIQMVIECIV